MRCPACGAHNPDGAAWCSQCYHRFHQQASPAAAPATRAPVAEDGDEAREAAAGVTDGASDRFRSADDGVEWRCPACDVWNPMELTDCARCGTAFQRTLRLDDRDAPARDLPAGQVLAMSVVLPGSGHLLLGRTASGLGRVLLYLVWAVGGLVLLREAAATDQSVLPAIPLLGGALALIVTSVVDVLAVQRGDSTELLTPRVLLWLTVGVIGLTMVTLLTSALSVGS